LLLVKLRIGLDTRNKIGDVSQLRDHRRTQYEGVQVWLAHAPVDLVQALGQRQPGLCDQFSHWDLQKTNPWLLCELVLRGCVGATVVRLRQKPELSRCLQGVADVEKMAKHLGEILQRGMVAYALMKRSCSHAGSNREPRRLLAEVVSSAASSAEVFTAVALRASTAVVADLVPEVTGHRAVGLVMLCRNASRWESLLSARSRVMMPF
jgi:hypothetical protein